MLQEWERVHPGRTESIFSAICKVEAGHLADPALFDFANLRAIPMGEGIPDVRVSSEESGE
jgi:tRNA 2-thiocytidine biosynthesis protein TtcA